MELYFNSVIVLLVRWCGMQLPPPTVISGVTAPPPPPPTPAGANALVEGDDLQSDAESDPLDPNLELPNITLKPKKMGLGKFATTNQFKQKFAEWRDAPRLKNEELDECGIFDFVFQEEEGFTSTKIPKICKCIAI